MEQITYVLCNDARQADSVMKVIIESQLGIKAEILEICENGQRWIRMYYETGSDLLVLGIFLGRKTDLYKR